MILADKLHLWQVLRQYSTDNLTNFKEINIPKTVVPFSHCLYNVIKLR